MEEVGASVPTALQDCQACVGIPRCPQCAGDQAVELAVPEERAVVSRSRRSPSTAGRDVVVADAVVGGEGLTDVAGSNRIRICASMYPTSSPRVPSSSAVIASKATIRYLVVFLPPQLVEPGRRECLVGRHRLPERPLAPSSSRISARRQFRVIHRLDLAPWPHAADDSERGDTVRSDGCGGRVNGVPQDTPSTTGRRRARRRPRGRRGRSPPAWSAEEKIGRSPVG